MLIIKGKKMGMTREFTPAGVAVPVTVIALDATSGLEKGQELTVSGRSKGKGFAGAVKRWGFKGGPKTHGQSDRQRAPGSIGSTTFPGRVWPSKRMAGRLGGGRKTIRGLKVLDIDTEHKLIKVLGSTPGVRGGSLRLIIAGERSAEV